MALQNFFRKALPTVLSSVGGAVIQHGMGTSEDPGTYQPPQQPQQPTQPQPTPTPVHTPQPIPNANQGVARNVYQQEQFATNTSEDTEFMSYPMWRSGVATSEYIPPKVLKPIVDRESAPNNTNAANNRMMDGGIMSSLGALMTAYGPAFMKPFGVGMQVLGGTHMGAEVVARHQASQTKKVPDPDLTDDVDQIKSDYKALPKQYEDAGFGGQSKVVSILEPTKKNANVSKRIKKRLLPHEDPSFSKSSSSSSPSSSSSSSPSSSSSSSPGQGTERE